MQIIRRKKIFENVNLKVYRNNRIALIGENGCGKTTLVKMITGGEVCDSGEVKIGNSTRIAYMPQIIEFDNKEATVLETFCYEMSLGEDKARNVLAGFHFRAKDVMKKTGSLSGGEKSRLKLCLLMQGSVNFLILDEPTNHLDIESREWIEDAIYDFNGTILFISHDRYFLEKFAERIWSIEDSEVIEYNNGLDEYFEKLAKPKSKGKADHTASKQKTNSKANMQSKDSKNFKEDKKPENPKAEEIENRIGETEAKINATQNEIDAESDFIKIDYKKIDELYEEKLRLENILDSLYAEWISFSHRE